MRFHLVHLILAVLLLGSSGAARASEVRDYQNARALHEKGLYILAADEARAILEQYPDGDYRADARFLLGDSELRRGRYREARDAFRQVITEVGRHDLLDDALARLVECEIRLEEYTSALDHAARFLESQPDGALAGRMHLLRGQAHRSLNQPGQALKEFETAVEMGKGEDRTAALFYAGLTTLNDGKPAQASDYFSRAFETDRKGRYAQESLLYVAECSLRAEDYEATVRATEDFAKVFPASPYLGDALLREAQARAALNQSAEAIRVYCALTGRAIPELCAGSPRIGPATGFPNRIAAYAFLGLARIVKENESDRVYDALIKWTSGKTATGDFNPRFHAATAALEKARSLMRREHWEGAIASLDDLAARHAEPSIVPEALLDRAQCLFALNRYAEVQTACETLIRDHSSSPEAPRALLYLARSLAARNQIADASRSFQVLLSRPPERGLPDLRAQSAYYFGAMLFRIGKTAEALEQFTRIVDPAVAGGEISPEMRADAGRARAECLYQLERYPEAIAAYREAIKQYESLSGQSGNADAARLALGWALFKAGDLNAATEIFSRLSGDDASPARRLEARFMQGECALAGKRLDEAEEIFTSVASASPEGGFGLLSLYRAAWSIYRMEDWDRAAQAFAAFLDRAAAIKQSDLRGMDLLDDAAFHRAWALSQAGRESEAEPLFTAMARQSPDGAFAARAWVAAGDACYNEGRYADAADRYRKAASLHPDDPAAPGALHALGWALQADGKTQEAAKVWEDLAALYPQSPIAREALYSGGEALYRGKDYAEARRIFQSIVSRFPETEEAQEASYWLGRSLVEGGSVIPGARLLAAYSRQYPQSSHALEALYYSGRAYETANQSATAAATFNAVLLQAEATRSATGTDAVILGECLYSLGENSRREGRAEDAASFFARASSSPGALAETQRAAMKAEGDAWREAGQHEKSLDAYQRLIAGEKGDSTEAAAQFGAGLALESLGRYEDAAAAYLRIPNLYGKDETQTPAAYARAGLCLEKIERWEEAAKVYRQCLEIPPSGTNGAELRRQAKERLDWIEKNEGLLDIVLPRSAPAGAGERTP